MWFSECQLVACHGYLKIQLASARLWNSQCRVRSPKDLESGCGRFLDVGSGCGILTACGAWIVGHSGLAVGIDIRQGAVDMAATNVRRLTACSSAYALAAAPARFELHNVFMLEPRHKV